MKKCKKFRAAGVIPPLDKGGSVYTFVRKVASSTLIYIQNGCLTSHSSSTSALFSYLGCFPSGPTRGEVLRLHHHVRMVLQKKKKEDCYEQRNVIGNALFQKFISSRVTPGRVRRDTDMLWRNRRLLVPSRLR